MFIGIYIISAVYIINVWCTLNSHIVVNFCHLKNLTRGSIFGCMTEKEKHVFLKTLMKFSLWFLYTDLNKYPPNFDSVLSGKYDRRLVVVVDGDCANISSITNRDVGKKYFFETFHWLIVASSKDKVLDKLQNTRLNINSDVHLAVCKNKNNCAIYDVYNPASEHGGTLVHINWGVFNDSEGYRAYVLENKYWTRRNMTGVIFKSAVVLPNIDGSLKDYLNSDENRQINSMHRFQSVCVNYCRDFFNFSLDIQKTDSWGYVQPDGHFDGLVSLLEQRVVDFGSSPLIFKLDRLPVVDYSYGTWILRSTFIYRRPKALSDSYQIFLRPLAKYAWICVFIAMFIIIVTLRIVFSHELTSGRGRNILDSSWSFLCLFTLGALCQQGASLHPRFFSGRILSISIYLFCILIYQFYSAGIVSYLLMDPPRTINNLKDLTESELHVGIEDILIDRNYFVQTTDPYAKELYKRKIEDVNINETGFFSPVEGLELVRRGGFAFHVETSTAYPIIEETFSNEVICELEEVQLYRTQPMHANLQKNSPFKEMMNYCMFKMAENGNLDRLRKHWDARKPACIQSAKKIVINVSLKEFSCGPITLMYGICFALFFLLLEIIFYYRNKIVTPINSILYT